MDRTKYIGMDVHKDTISIAVMNSSGKLVMESILETKAATIVQFVEGLRGSLHVTFEPGFPFWASVRLCHSPAPRVVQRFDLRSRSILRLAALRPWVWSGTGHFAPLAPTQPTLLRACLAATPMVAVARLAALPSRHRQHRQSVQHLVEQPPVKVALGQQQPVVAGMLDQPTAGLHQPML